MTQASIAISTTPPLPGVQLVEQANGALEAIATDFAGTTDPASFAGPYMTWADTGTGTLWRRNAAGSAWVEIGRVLERPLFLSDVSSGAIPTGGFKNKLINAQGTINQRVYVSGTATGVANQYTLDRWRIVTSGQNLAFTQTGVQMVMTAPAGGVEQVIEGAFLEGGTYSLSWTGTATATVNGSPVTNGGTITLPAGTNATVRFIGGTFSLPQLEVGHATPFEYQPPDIALLRCQRYFEKSYPQGSNPGGIGGGAHQSMIATGYLLSAPSVYFKVTKRVTPTLHIYSPQTGSAASMAEFDAGGTFVADRSPGPSNTGTTGFSLGGNGSMTPGNFIMSHWLAEADF